ncbi:Phospholipase D [Lecanosticta acicola]|uniref:Mitochondrial cardiolipin hydrolase n=1 Tax=Lecanosticta acicola TaxID=111012 RepID=A0AAI8Z4W0_9PEZI|nr:Phospholipase D [Lecanosticta acicola]
MARTRKQASESKTSHTSGVTKTRASHPRRGRPTKSTSKRSGKPSNEPPPIRLTSATNTTAPDFVVHGSVDDALFSLTCYRGEGMCLLAMNWKQGTPTDDFVGFAIEFLPPGGQQFYALQNRLAFPTSKGSIDPNTQSSRLSPFQKFRWIHFPSDAETPGDFTYRVTPVFMDARGVLSYGHYQEAALELGAETYPGQCNIAFTRGFISSQAFVDKFGTNGGVGTILPTSAKTSLDFKPTYPNEEQALSWMGFEAREVILNVLDAAIADTTAQVRVSAYDFNDMEIVSRLEKVGSRLRIIIDDSGSHKAADSSESKAADLLAKSAGAENVQRQHMGGLQHSKSIIVNGDKTKVAIGGSTNLSWRGIYVQNNNLVALQGAKAVEIFTTAFDARWDAKDDPSAFDNTPSADWNDLGYADFDAQVTFSPHSKSNAKLAEIADAIAATQSSLLYSLAFLYETKGVIRDAITKLTDDQDTTKDVFVYGISDKSVGGLDLQEPNGNPPVAFPAALMTQNVPAPFRQEATGGNGTRLHHKFLVCDFNTPRARVYTGSYNFSHAADSKNSENLFCIRDARVATSFAVEALALFDHYTFRDLKEGKGEENGGDEEEGESPLELKVPPAEGGKGEMAWWGVYWSEETKKRDRELFCGGDGGGSSKGQ